MKKIIAFVLALVMILPLAACGGKGEAEVAEVSHSAPQTQSSAQSGSSSQDAGASQSTDASQSKVDYNVPEIDQSKRMSDIEITSLKMSKKSYSADEPIVVTVTWKGTPAEDCWVGIIPAEVEHGDEYLNDEHDVDYRYLSGEVSGEEIVFETYLEPGDYTMRVNENDNGGVELGWCEFKVK